LPLLGSAGNKFLYVRLSELKNKANPDIREASKNYARLKTGRKKRGGSKQVQTLEEIYSDDGENNLEGKTRGGGKGGYRRI